LKYDPIKRSLGQVFNTTPALRILFYKLLDLLLLRTWYVKRELRQWIAGNPGERSILDAGSGFGQYTWFISGMSPSWKVLAVDVKEEQIADCTRFFEKAGRRNVTFETADLTTFDRKETFDFILSVDVMEHIAPDEQVFGNFFSSLKAGGMLLVSTPSDQGGSDVHDHDGEESFIDEHVRDGYNIDDIRQKLSRAGFTHTEAYYSYGKPGQAAWRISMKVPIRLLNASKLFFIIIPFYYLFMYPVAFCLNHLDVRRKHTTGTGLIVKAWK
jgi:2-polyprenyl-3-methyl-5-hydroxy-6-metoxy-1,4-benzoquinol methylase